MELKRVDRQEEIGTERKMVWNGGLGSSACFSRPPDVRILLLRILCLAGLMFACLLLIQGRPSPHLVKPDQMKEPFVTFVIATKGRRSLGRALGSILQQTNPWWEAVVVVNFLQWSARDSFKYLALPAEITEDKRFIFKQVHRGKFRKNCAGTLRNLGVRIARTPWVAFLDDDDELSKSYVELLWKEVRKNNSNLVVFRMFNRMLTPQILPPLEATQLELNKVGISFAFSKESSTPEFVDSSVEDFNLLADHCNSPNGLCTLSPHLLYFVHGFGQELPLTQGTHIERIGCAVDSEVNRTLTNMLQSCHTEVPSQIEEQFLFSEMASPFFGWNVQALKASMASAVDRGCRLPSSGPFHIIFDAKAPPLSENFIQIQLEQPDTRHFTDEYVSKLKQSKQIWAVSDAGAKYLAKFVSTSKVFLVPTTTYTLVRQQLQWCRDSITIKEFAFQYHKGCYYQLKNTHSQLEHVDASNTIVPEREASCEQISVWGSCPAIQPLLKSDVLMYGLLEGSYHCRRELLCDDLANSGINIICLQGVFGEELDHFICNTKIVVVEHYYSHSFLETHRIDPLIQGGKIVVVVPSNDVELDKKYAPYVTFSHRDELITDINRILGSLEIHLQLANRNAKTFAKKMHELNPLCTALESL